MRNERFDQFLQIVTPQISDALVRASGSPSPAALRATIEKLQGMVEQLRVSHEELRQAQVQVGEPKSGEESERTDFERIFDASPYPMLVTDADSLIRAANAAAAALLGVRAESLRGKPLEVFVAESDRHGFRITQQSLRRELGARTLPLRLRQGSGTPLEAVVTVVPLLRPGGARTLLWTARAAEAGVSDAGPSEELETLRAVLRSLPSAVAVMDLDGTVLAWNPAAERLLGWSEDEAAGRSNPALPEEGLHPPQGAGEGRVSWLRLGAAHRDGHAVDVELVLGPLVGPGGERRGTVAVIAAGGREPGDDEGAEPSAGRDEAQARGREPLTPERVLPEGGGDFLERLRAGIAAGLHLGRITPGDRLPSIRDAARVARTDHRVVSAAYRQLAGEGVVHVVNRRGVTVAPLPGAEGASLSESADWLARVLADAWDLRVKVQQIPDLVRDLTSATRLRCACVESTEDDLAALTGELAAQWGLATFAVRLDDGVPDAPARRAALADAMRGAELAVTTAFHARAVAPVAQAMGIPLVVAAMSADVVEAVEERLRKGPLTAVVADERWGARLRAALGGARVRVVRADDAASVAALDPAEPVLLTRAARERIGGPRPRLLVPPTHFLSTRCAAEIARVLIRRNVEAARSLN